MATFFEGNLFFGGGAVGLHSEVYYRCFICVCVDIVECELLNIAVDQFYCCNVSK